MESLPLKFSFADGDFNQLLSSTYVLFFPELF